MAHAFFHAKSSAAKFGGTPEDYVAIHEWFDASKAHLPDMRHRALRHHSQGIFWAEEVFGRTITNSQGKEVPVRLVGEQHVLEDFGFIPTLQDWFSNMEKADWMHKGAKALSRQEP